MLVLVRFATPCKQGCAADSKRCAGTAPHHHGAGAGIGAGVGAGAGAAAGAGALFGSFWGAQAADLGSLFAALGSLLGVSFGSWEKGCRQQLKTSKTAPVCSARPVLLKRFPPFVLAVRSLAQASHAFWFFVQQITFQKNTPLCSARPLLGKSAGQKGPITAEGCCF